MNLMISLSDMFAIVNMRHKVDCSMLHYLKFTCALFYISINHDIMREISEKCDFLF
jgi:hypothetical protein